MKPITITRSIAAPINVVFLTISDIRNFATAVPHIKAVEFLSEQQMGVGTRFRETRVMKGREQTTDLEVAEYVENERVRIVSDSGGTVWDTLFTVADGADGCVEMTMVMEAKPHTLLARLVNPLIRGMVVDAVEDDMDAVKVFCESP
ncbi:MAG: SRPBCC family protein [Cyanobacteria bacterium P01_F01_bin.53]